jgi:polysaccharide export outer membrane protein
MRFSDMNPRLFAQSCLSLLAAVLIAGCASPPSEPPGSPSPAPADGQTAAPGTGASIDEIRVGEKITVIVADIPQPYNHVQQVRADGTISLPLDVVVTAAGKRKNNLQEEIRSKYVPRFFARCTVTVETEDRFFFVNGMVRASNRYPYTGEMTVLRAISVAGGFNEFAKKNKVLVTRPNGKRITVDCKKAEKDPKYDVPIFPGDTVFVDRKVW